MIVDKVSLIRHRLRRCHLPPGGRLISSSLTVRLPLGEAVERSETDEGKGGFIFSVSPHPSFASQMPPSPRGRLWWIPPHAATKVTPGSATTPRHPPTQAAKKCRIGPQLVPVPPAESPVDGAGPQRGRKDGPPDSYLEPLNPHGSPFFFGFQKPFFFQQGKRNGFCRPRKVRTVQNALSGISHSAPLLVLSPRDPLRWARAGAP